MRDFGALSELPDSSGHNKLEEFRYAKIISRFAKDESGATAIEYGLIASLVSIVAIAAFKSVGSKLTSTFNDIASNLSS